MKEILKKLQEEKDSYTNHSALREDGYLQGIQKAIGLIKNEIKPHVINWVVVTDEMPKITTNTMSDWVLTFSKNECRIDKAFFSKVNGWQAEHGEPMNVDYWQPLPKPPCL